jgi:hypothetical protein
MATWHQNRNSVKLYHDTDWVIVTDPPGEMRTSMVFKTEARAKEILAMWNEHGRNPHSYILPPASAYKKV